MEQNAILKKILISVILLLAACISFFLLARLASSNATFSGIHSSIDQKTKSVLGLSASSAAISTGISLLPGDAASPIAEKFADLTGYFVLILCVLYTEKSMLAVLGVAVFKYVIPVACGLLIVYQFWNREALRKLAAKLVVMGLVVFLAIPISLKLSDSIYESHKEIVETASSDAEQLKETTSQLSDADETHNPITAILNKIQESTSGLLKKCTEMLNRFIESIAVFIVTTCVIPLVVLALFIWLTNKLFGTAIRFPDPKKWRRVFFSGSSEREDDEDFFDEEAEEE